VAPRNIVLLVLFVGCGGELHRENLPYRYRQSMLDPEARANETRREPQARAAPRRAADGNQRRQLAAKCRRLIGQRLAGDHDQAMLQLVRHCLGPAAPERELSQRRLGVHRAQPRLGDLLVFHDTRDLNGNRQLDDPFTDVGLVIGRAGDRLEFVFVRQGCATLGLVNPAQPARRRTSGEIENSYLRVIRPDDPPGTVYLAGQLLAGMAEVELRAKVL
jgi:hypothetical protein